jgi:hypothetical protein
VFSLVLAGLISVFYGPAKTMAAIAIVLLVLYRPLESVSAVILFSILFYLYKTRFK